MLASVQHEPPFERVIGPPPAAESAHAVDGVACRLCAGQDPAAAAAHQPGRASHAGAGARYRAAPPPADAAGGAGGLRQDRRADAADPAAAAGQCAGLDLGRRGRPAAALPGLPDHRAGAARPALARLARGPGHAGAGRAWPARRRPRAGQRLGRHRGHARADRHRRRPPAGRPAGLRAAAGGDRAPARALGCGHRQPGRPAVVAGALARQWRPGRVSPVRPALQRGRGECAGAQQRGGRIFARRRANCWR